VEEYRVHRPIVVSLDPGPRVMGGVEVLPWRESLDRLWYGDVVGRRR
jgi:hypothetical protein